VPDAVDDDAPAIPALDGGAPDIEPDLGAAPDGPLDRTPRVRTVLLSTLTTLAGTGLAVVLFSNAYAAPVVGPGAEPSATAVGVQQYATSGDYDLEAVKRDRLKAVEVVAGAAGGAVDLPALKPVAPAGEAQQYAAAQVSARGWSKKDFACLVSLWNKESGWNAHAGRVNGPYGIPQAYPGTKMAAAGGDWLNDHRVQIRWGLGYIAGRYGTPCGAWASSVSTGSY